MWLHVQLRVCPSYQRITTLNQVAQHFINLTMQKAHDERVEGLRRGISRGFGLSLSTSSDRFSLLSSEDVSLGRTYFQKSEPLLLMI